MFAYNEVNIINLNLSKVRTMSIILFTLLLWSCEPETISPSGGGGTYPPSYGSNIEMSTSFSNDLDDWKFKIGDSTVDVETAFMEDWDNWNFSGSGVTGAIETDFMEDWDQWKLTSSGHTIRMRTSFSNDWDDWDIDETTTGWHADVRTTFSNDFDDWNIDFEGYHLDVRTAFSNDWDDWDANGDFPSDLPLEHRVAVLFVPIMVGALIQAGEIEP